MSGGALVIAAAGGVLAALCAAADGSLLALDGEVGGDARLATIYADRERLHRTLSFGRVVALLAAGAAVAAGLAFAARPRLDAALISIFVAIVMLSIVESGARALGDALGPAAALRLAPLMTGLEVLLAPAVWLGSRLDGALRRLLPPPRVREDEREAAAEQFRQVVAAEADVSQDEGALLQGVFSLGETAVRDIMIPRVDIVGIASDTPWSEVVDRVRSSEHARFPVYEETLDDVVGILYAKDMLAPVIADAQPEGGWLSIVRPAVFIPATNTIDTQLRDFKASRTHIAIVIDEYGGTAGLVTIEDVLEEIVGDIRDEYDVEEPEIEEGHEGGRYWVSGRLTLSELSEELHHDFERDDVTTVGGLVYEELGRVPRAGEQLVIGPFRVVVERVRRRRIERVYFERLPAPEPVGDDDADDADEDEES
ncbi:MAG TPA: hemolysin family protein [Gemmatimonadaceae bacterium]|nr:hemolysin family protein [Gemmatimonadaceae bacterium]